MADANETGDAEEEQRAEDNEASIHNDIEGQQRVQEENTSVESAQPSQRIVGNTERHEAISALQKKMSAGKNDDGTDRKSPPPLQGARIIGNTARRQAASNLFKKSQKQGNSNKQNKETKGTVARLDDASSPSSSFLAKTGTTIASLDHDEESAGTFPFWVANCKLTIGGIGLPQFDMLVYTLFSNLFVRTDTRLAFFLLVSPKKHQPWCRPLPRRRVPLTMRVVCPLPRDA